MLDAGKKVDQNTVYEIWGFQAVKTSGSPDEGRRSVNVYQTTRANKPVVIFILTAAARTWNLTGEFQDQRTEEIFSRKLFLTESFYMGECIIISGNPTYLITALKFDRKLIYGNSERANAPLPRHEVQPNRWWWWSWWWWHSDHISAGGWLGQQPRCCHECDLPLPHCKASPWARPSPTVIFADYRNPSLQKQTKRRSP